MTTPIEPLYVVDTNALIWYLTNSNRLSASASAIFTTAERGEAQLIIPVIALAELYYANLKFKLALDFRQLLEDLRSKPYFRLVAMQPDDVLDFGKDSGNLEMHDLIIVGVAQRFGAPLITSDRQIQAAGQVRIAW